MTPEGRVKQRLKDYLKGIDAYWFMPVQGGYGAPALDFICCYKGHYFEVETKAGNKDMTPRQKRIAERIEKAGGRAFLINEEEETWEALHNWLLLITR